MKKGLIMAAALVFSCGSAFAGSYRFDDGTPENTYVTTFQAVNGAQGKNAASHKEKAAVKQQPVASDDMAAPNVTRFGDGTPEQ